MINSRTDHVKLTITGDIYMRRIVDKQAVCVCVYVCVCVGGGGGGGKLSYPVTLKKVQIWAWELICRGIL